MRVRKVYEWDIETVAVDAEEYCEVLDHNHASELSDYSCGQLSDALSGVVVDGKSTLLCLVYDTICDVRGLLDRQRVYAQGFLLPDFFDDCYAVPERFKQELESQRLRVEMWKSNNQQHNRRH